MPTKKTLVCELPKVPKELLEQFSAVLLMNAEAIEEASAASKKALIEQALNAELGHHLGYPPGAQRPEDETNQRNGKSGKTVLTGDGPLRLDIPRDRDGSFSPTLIPKYELRYTGFDDKIIAMYACGMTVREIRAFLSEQNGADVSPDFISSVTDEVMEEISAWQQRPLEADVPGHFL